MCVLLRLSGVLFLLVLVRIGSPGFGCFFFQAEDGIRDLVRSRGLGDVYKRQPFSRTRIEPALSDCGRVVGASRCPSSISPSSAASARFGVTRSASGKLSLIHL